MLDSSCVTNQRKNGKKEQIRTLQQNSVRGRQNELRTLKENITALSVSLFRESGSQTGKDEEELKLFIRASRTLAVWWADLLDVNAEVTGGNIKEDWERQVQNHHDSCFQGRKQF